MSSEDRGPVSCNRQPAGRNGSSKEERDQRVPPQEQFSVVAWNRKWTNWLSRLPQWRAPHLIGEGKGRYPQRVSLDQPR